MTGPLYEYDKEKNRLVNENPVDSLLLTRYRGYVRPDALGPRFTSIDDISKSFERVSSVTIPGEESMGGGTWTFEQWDRKRF